MYSRRWNNNKIRNTHPSYCVDNAIGAKIVPLFAKKYYAWYNYVCYDYNKMTNLCNDIVVRW